MGLTGYFRVCACARRRLTLALIIAIAGLLISAGGAGAATTGMFLLTPSVDFGRGVVDSGDYTKPIEVLNETGTTQQIGNPSTSSPDFFVDANAGTCGIGAIQSGAECTVAAGWEPVDFGTVTATLTIPFCHNGSGCTTFTVPVSGNTVLGERLSIAPSPLTFGSTALDTLSGAEEVTITNGAIETSVSGLSVSGSAPDDFVIVNDHCTGAVLAANASCTFDVRFAPTQGGIRSATLALNGATLGQTYPTLTLSGTGGSLPAGPAGQPGSTGPAGPTGPAGQTGAAGPAGQVELVTCKTVTAHAGHRTTRHQKCTATLVSGPVKFTTSGSAIHATISHGRAPLATATAVPLESGGWRLLIGGSRRLRRGVYTLTLHTAHGPRRVAINLT